VPPFTVLCCDNLPDNGNSTRMLVGRFARLNDTPIADFIENEVVFPNTMVDKDAAPPYEPQRRTRPRAPRFRAASSASTSAPPLCAVGRPGAREQQD
jgi:mannitol 2-dehydrogenase